MPFENWVLQRHPVRHDSFFLLLFFVTISIIHQPFIAESFSFRSHLNHTKIGLVWNPNCNADPESPFSKLSLLHPSKIESFFKMNHYRDLMEDLRKELLDTIPAATNNNKGTHSDSDLDKAMDFLDAHSPPNKLAWKQQLHKYVALKEAVEGFKKQKSPIDVPEGQMEKLFENPDLLEEMLLADGAAGGNYAKAMEIYQEIYNESEVVGDPEYPILRKLAVAIALVHASPVAQTNPLEPPPEDIPDDVVDPVRRYLNYETAYMEGELDPNFDTLTIWELRFVVDGDESDEVASWGRQTLRNFFPDHVLNRNRDWLYVGIVRSDIPYGSSRVKEDDPKLHKYQNILRNGGICGRRAFFGRFILRAFGIPTTARPSKGHAALCHWRPDDGTWTVNLGGGWGAGWTKTRYCKDVDFEATTRARQTKDYAKVKLAQWIGDLFDEKQVYGVCNEKERGQRKPILLDLEEKSNVGLWYRLSLKIQESILANHKPANRKRQQGSPVENLIDTATKEKSKQGSVVCGDENGRTTIRIPASTYANPRKTKDVKIMKSMHISEDDTNGSETGNEQIYLPSFSPSGTTIMRGGTWKTPSCTSGERLLSGGYGRYEDWGLRAAMEVDGGEEESACPDSEITVQLSDSVSMEFVYIPPGQFVMGGHNNKDGRFKCVELPHHPVQITKGFYLGKFPVTQEQFMTVMNGKNPSKSTKHPKCPVDNVGVDDAKGFCRAATEVTGSNIRLPSEAEWEYASRGTTNGTSADPQCFFGSDESQLGEYAWCKQNANGKSHPVGLKKPNPFGLYDIYGNVWERVSDTYHKDYYGQGKGETMVDPTGPSQGTKSRFKYDLPSVPESGNYLLTAKVCTVNVNQQLRISTNKYDDDKGQTLNLLYTLGEWKQTEPIVVQLKEGPNSIYFWRDAPPQYGISIKEFVLTKAN